MTSVLPLSERVFQRTVTDTATRLGWTTYHTHDSRRSDPGFPDLVCVRDRHLFLELKTEKGRLSPEQKRWMRALLDAGAEAYVVRPADFDHLAHVLKLHVNPYEAHDHHAMVLDASTYEALGA